MLKSRDASFVTLEYKVDDQAQTARYAISQDTTWVNDLKVGDECTVTFVRDGDRQVAVSIAKNEPEN